jgi:hypothetical protein
MKFIVLVTWKSTGKVEPYANVRALTSNYPSLNENAIYFKISRQKEAYEDEILIIERKEIIR